MARILLIDDYPDIRLVVRLALCQVGHEVLEAGNGEEGLRLADGGGIDLVLCDLFMPEKDGLETIRELTRDHPGLPVVAMSGGGGDGRLDVLPVARHLGAVALLKKPFKTDALLAAVGAALAPREPVSVC
jgi:CheY-like chemotaxis protein